MTRGLSVVDPTQWASNCKGLRDYADPPTHYIDIHYRCNACGQQAVFSATEQKHTYEVRKQHINRRRTLCPACNGEHYRLRLRDREMQRRWLAERATLRHDRVFVEEWLLVLVAAARYRRGVNLGMIKRLRKLL